MREIYQKVRAQLKEVPLLKYIDLDTAQLEKYTGKPPVNFPCALIRIALTGCTDLGGGVQRCTCLVTVRLAFDFPKMETASIYTDVKIDNALSYFDTYEAAYKALQGYTDSEVEEFSRTSATPEMREDGLTVLAIPFSTEFDDYTAAKH